MNKQRRSLLRWTRHALVAGTSVLLILVLVFTVQASLRETQTRHAAAPATGRFIQAGDSELFIQEMGPPSGPAVVFIHGTGAWSGFWRETMSAFAQAGFYCVAIDMPPFGFSERPTALAYGRVDQAKRILAALDALQINKVTLVGHSFGGGATVETAMLIPDRVEAMVLADVGGLGLTLPGQDAPAQQSAWLRVLGIRPVRHALTASSATNPLLTRSLLKTLIHDPAAATDARIQTLQQPMVLEHSTATFGDWVLFTLTTHEQSLSSDPASYQTLDMPVLLVWGEHDTTVPVAAGQYLHSLLPSSELAIMPQVNHIPHIEAPAAFNEIVLSFLGQQLH